MTTQISDPDVIRGFAISIVGKEFKIDTSGLIPGKTNIVVGMKPMVVALVYYYRFKANVHKFDMRKISEDSEYLTLVYNKLLKSKEIPGDKQRQDILVLLYRYIRVMYG